MNRRVQQLEKRDLEPLEDSKHPSRYTFSCPGCDRRCVCGRAPSWYECPRCRLVYELPSGQFASRWRLHQQLSEAQASVCLPYLYYQATTESVTPSGAKSHFRCAECGRDYSFDVASVPEGCGAVLHARGRQELGL